MAKLTPTSAIKQAIKEKDTGIWTGTEAMLAIIEDLRKQVIGRLGEAAVGSWDQYQLRRMLDSIEYQVSNFSEKAKAEADGLLDKSWGFGENLVDAPLKVTGLYYGYHISTSSLDALKDFTFHKINELSNVAWNKLKGELTLGMMGGKSPQEVASAIGKSLRRPSIFGSIAERAEVITQTEMGRVFSTAAQMRMKQAAQYVPDLQKVWIHAGHPKKARPSHLAAHGQHVPVNEPFNIGGVEMMHPRDPRAPIGEVIRCGCDHVTWTPRWGDSPTAGFKLPAYLEIERQKLAA